jgi:hypothetical protein
MRAAIRPIVNDVVVVGNIDGVEVDGTELRHLSNEEIGEAFPAGAARIGRTAFSLERVPFEGLIGGDHELWVDSWK